ncbi:MAG TPA: hypothetical protein VFW45_18330 [Candidatus Polarisedimenticolia bacterium]|nr:hypothetical protein [Candidatus Polarisedimenticolia bacterium]
MIDHAHPTPHPLPRSGWALIVALACASGTGASLAQTPPPQKPPGGTSPDLPIREGSSVRNEDAPTPNQFHLDFNAGARSSSNVFFDPDDGSPQQDYIGTLVMDLSATRTSPRTAWTMAYVPVLNHYQTYDQLDSTSHAFNYTGRYRLGVRGGLNLQEHFTLSNDPIIVSTPQEGDSPILANNQRVTRNRAEINMDRELSRRTRFNIGATHILNRYEDENFQDSDGLLGLIGLDFAVRREDTLGMSLSGGRLQFEDDVPDVTSESAALNWSHVQDRSRVELSGGATVAKQTETDSFFSGSAALYRRFGRNAEFGGGWRRSLTADVGNNGTSVGDRVFMTISGDAGRHLTLMASADYGRRESVAGASEVNLDLWGGSFRARVSMGQRWGLVTGANYRRQETVQPDIGSQTVNNYYLGITCRAF